MTRKEALKRVRGYLTDCLPIDDNGELDEIMGALEQKPCEDTISREEVIDTFKHWYSELLLNKEETDFCDIVRELPSVQPKTDIALRRYTVGDVYYEKNTGVGISKKAVTVSESEGWNARSYYDRLCDEVRETICKTLWLQE